MALHSIIRELADDDRAYDPFGAAMGALSALCNVLHVEGETVPADAGFRPAMGQGDIDPDDIRAVMVLAALRPDRFPGYWVEGYAPSPLSVADVQYAVRILSRYVDWCHVAGRAY